jgi:hypothetical protein
MRYAKGALLLCPALAALLLVMAGCASIETGSRMVPVSLTLDNTLQLPFKAEKALLDQTSGTYYIQEQGRPFIYFYRNNAQINSIGGLGTDNTNFQRLADIALDPDGNLLALDSFAKRIRKYTPDGKWIADFELAKFNQPARFCSTPDGDLIIYDNATQELSRISGLDGSLVFAFGRFVVDSVSNLTAGKDYITAVNIAFDRTVLFSALGQFVDEYPYQIVLDRYQNQYYYENGALKYERTDLRYPLGWHNREVRLLASDRALLLVRDMTVLTITPAYEGNTEP